MKKIAIPYLLLAIFSLSIFSCSKDEIVENNTTAKNARANTTTKTTEISDGPITAINYANNLGKGFDVAWSEFTKYMNSFNEQSVVDYKNAGFDHVRIRIGDTIPDAAFIARLKTQVDYCIAHDVSPIIAYQASYVENDAPSETAAKRHLANWWRNMATEFQGYSHKLSFNVLVEISGTYGTNYTAVNGFYVDVLAAIRETNPDRVVIFPPVKLSDPLNLQYLQIPGTNDPYTMAEWHFYAAGPNTIDPTNKKYWLDGSTAQERLNVTGPIQTAKEWMQTTGYATWVGAWMAGNYNKGNTLTIPDQVGFATFMTRELAKANIPWSINTDDKFYDMVTNTWYDTTTDAAGRPVRDVLVDTEKISLYSGSSYSGTSARLAPGNYNKTELSNLGFFTNINSIMVPFDFEVRVYSKVGFTGTEKIYTKTQESLNGFVVRSMKVIALNNY